MLLRLTVQTLISIPYTIAGTQIPSFSTAGDGGNGGVAIHDFIGAFSVSLATLLGADDMTVEGHTPDPTPYTLHPTPYTLHRYTLHYTLHPRPETPDPTPYTPDPRPQTLDPRLQILDPRPQTPDPRP
eukprot:3942001-Rhodomonas_salina.3